MHCARTPLKFEYQSTWLNKSPDGRRRPPSLPNYIPRPTAMSVPNYRVPLYITSG